MATNKRGGVHCVGRVPWFMFVHGVSVEVMHQCLLLLVLLSLIACGNFASRRQHPLNHPPDASEFLMGEASSLASRMTSKSSRSLKIANGRSIGKTAVRRFPYSALMVFKDPSSGQSGRRVCAGVLIFPQWVLTAGSCVARANDVRDIAIGFGDDVAKPDDLFYDEAARLVMNKVMYPDFNGKPQDGADLALLYLKKEVNVSRPGLPSVEAPLWEGQRLIGLGWGITDVNDVYANKMQVADPLDFIESNKCVHAWNATASIDANIDERVICALPKDDNGDASISICDGDEGGPLLVLDATSFNEESRLVFSQGSPEDDRVYGIASFASDACGHAKVSVYTNIAEYMDWINDTTQGFVPPRLIIVPSTETDRQQTVNTPSDESVDALEIGLSVAGVVLGIAVVLVIIILFVRRPLLRRSGSSAHWNSVTGLKNADDAERRHQQMALMSLSPFLTTTDIDTPRTVGSPSGHHRLPLNIQVLLSGKKLGTGAFGRVEEGIYIHQDGIRHKVAVKMNFGEIESRDTLLNEIRIFERVGSHPNIVHCFGGRLHDAVDDKQGYYIIEELMSTDLGKFFKDPKKRKKTTFQQFLEIFYEIANGLEHLHNCDVIHFDLKPGNILLDEDLHPKLADFGCSRQRARSYITAGARGTVAYMAPELWLLGMYAKKAQVRAEKLDVFSYGVVMWESLTNSRPSDPLNVELVDSELLPTEQEVTAQNTNDDFRADRFPLTAQSCPDTLKAFIWDCVSYYNQLRPTVQEIKQRIGDLMTMEWIHLNIDQYNMKHR